MKKIKQNKIYRIFYIFLRIFIKRGNYSLLYLNFQIFLNKKI